MNRRVGNQWAQKVLEGCFGLLKEGMHVRCCRHKRSWENRNFSLSMLKRRATILGAAVASCLHFRVLVAPRRLVILTCPALSTFLHTLHGEAPHAGGLQRQRRRVVSGMGRLCVVIPFSPSDERCPLCGQGMVLGYERRLSYHGGWSFDSTTRVWVQTTVSFLGALKSSTCVG